MYICISQYVYLTKCITLVQISGSNEQLYLYLKDWSSQAQSLKQGENSIFSAFYGFYWTF